jgi:hypothetical protein
MLTQLGGNEAAAQDMDFRRLPWRVRVDYAR